MWVYCTVAVTGAFAGVQNLQIESTPPDSQFEFQDKSSLFWERFELAFTQNGDKLFADRFHPLSFFGKNLHDPDHFRGRVNSTAQGTISKSFVKGIREATADLPILLEWKEHESFLGEFIWNSVNSVDEEEVASLDLTYRPVERSWWNELKHTKKIRYGIRPFRPDPYAFVGTSIMDGSDLIMLGNVRYYYKDFSNHRFELAVSVPLLHGFAIDIGTSYEFGRHHEEKRLAVKLFKGLKNGGVIHLGFEAQKDPVLLAGVSTPW